MEQHSDRPATTTAEDRAEGEGRAYVISKAGAFYRPNAEGYTRSEAEAGRFTLAEAESHSHPNGPDGPRDGITYRLATQPAPVSGADAVIEYIDERITSFVAGEHSSNGPDANNLVVRELTYVLHLLAGNIYPEHPAREMKRVAQNESRVGLDTDCQSNSSLPHRLTGLEVRESGIEPLSSDLSSLACPSTPPQPFHNNPSDSGAQAASPEPCLHTWCGFDGRLCFDCTAAIRHKIEAYRNSGIDECLNQIPALERMLNCDAERSDNDGK